MSRSIQVALVALLIATVGVIGLAAPTPTAHVDPASPSTFVVPPTPSNGTPSICVGPNETSFDGGCISQENNEQPAYVAQNGSSNDTFDFGFGELVEITPANGIVAQADLLDPVPEVTTVNSTAQETNFTTTWADSVTNSSGIWNPNYARNEGWPQGTQVLGNVTVTLVFHVKHSGSSRWEIKYDFQEAGWPWVSDADELGMLFFAHAPLNSTPTYYPGNRTLVDLDNTTHAALAGFAFGATASDGVSESTLGVDVAVGTYYPTTPHGHATSLVLLNFTGGPGGYPSLSYDPWVLFSPVPSTIGVAPPPSISSFVPSPSTITLGSSTTFSVMAGGGTSPYRYAYTGLPPGCSTANTASLACTPASAGTFNVTVTVTDASSETATSWTTLTVNSVQGPTISSFTASPSTLFLGNSTDLAVSVTGGALPYTYAYAGLPAGCASSNTASLACTPRAAGTYSLSVTVVDANGKNASASVTITVNSVSSPPPPHSSARGIPLTSWVAVGILVALIAVLSVAAWSESLGRALPGRKEPTPADLTVPEQVSTDPVATPVPIALEEHGGEDQGTGDGQGYIW